MRRGSPLPVASTLALKLTLLVRTSLMCTPSDKGSDLQTFTERQAGTGRITAQPRELATRRLCDENPGTRAQNGTRVWGAVPLAKGVTCPTSVSPLLFPQACSKGEENTVASTWHPEEQGLHRSHSTGRKEHRWVFPAFTTARGCCTFPYFLARVSVRNCSLNVTERTSSE